MAFSLISSSSELKYIFYHINRVGVRILLFWPCSITASHFKTVSQSGPLMKLTHIIGLFLSQKGTQFTDLRASVPGGKQFCPGTRVPVSRIEGNVPHLRAKFTHFVGYLPSRIVCMNLRQMGFQHFCG